jgi:hypothetical protein
MRMQRFIKRRPRSYMINSYTARIFEVEQKVWLFDSELKLFPGKLRSRWR